MRFSRFMVAALVAVGFVLSFAASSQAVITVWVPFDTDKDGKAPGQPFPHFFDNPGASRPLGPGQPGFGNALSGSGGAANWCGDGTSCFMNDGSVTGAEGTIEFWVSPNWDGTNQGGGGVGGSGARQEFLHMGGTSVGPTAGVNIGIFNNNFPNDGGQLFASVKDTDSSNKIIESNDAFGPNFTGSTRDWTIGSWHHIAFTWDASTYTTWMDGDRIGQVAAGTGVAWPADMWLGGAGGPSAAFNGKIDDFTIRNNVQYDPSLESYTVPNAPAPEPATVLFLVAGGLLAGVRRRK
ncbi:MAG: hypothetical protein CMJ18_12030 [Phycisphaeraceae bacterium]|nr:hypothetical protein [Phycisphaeraceae bacterium]